MLHRIRHRQASSRPGRAARPGSLIAELMGLRMALHGTAGSPFGLCGRG